MFVFQSHADNISQTSAVETENLHQLTYVQANPQFSNHLRKISRDIYDSLWQHLGMQRSPLSLGPNSSQVPLKGNQKQCRSFNIWVKVLKQRLRTHSKSLILTDVMYYHKVATLQKKSEGGEMFFFGQHQGILRFVRDNHNSTPYIFLRNS